MTVVYKVAESRIKRGYSQYQLAKLSGVSRNTVSELEKGMNKPSFITMVKISIALEMDINELFRVIR